MNDACVAVGILLYNFFAFTHILTINNIHTKKKKHKNDNETTIIVN